MIDTSKKFLVAGAGKSGICASEQLLRNGEQVVLFDENPKGTLCLLYTSPSPRDS